jgi:phytoene dehydrogenase-like protein
VTQAVVVGSGPNGLAAAIRLAAEGLDVAVLEAADTPGGGTRSTEATLPGLVHDECSGFHPLAVKNDFMRHFDLTKFGLQWAWPEAQYAHPLEGGAGAAAWRSVEQTAAALGRDGAAYQRLYGPLTQRFDVIADEFLQPMMHLPRHPLTLARFGAYSAMPASVLARSWRTQEARALFGGVAAHAFRPLETIMSSAIGVALGTAAHRFGWPVALGGSRALNEAMLALLSKLGGRVETGVQVASLAELGDPDVVLLDTSPSAAADIIGERLPGRIARAYRSFRHGPGAFQVAFAVDGGIPWRYEPARAAGTVHVGGGFAEISAAEKAVSNGRMPERPFVLLGQQSVADPSRSTGGVHPVDAYAHVPSGWTGDATAAIVAQVERFAPGFKERVLATSVRSTTAIAASNANYIAGDIVSGANTPRQLVFRPRVALDPYTTGLRGVYLCSAATPPGAGAHGMCGYLAAGSALKRLRR